MQLSPPAKAPATRIVIGAGDGSGVDPAATDREILIEADPETATALTRRFARTDGVTVMALAVSAADGTAPLQVFNARALSSLRAAGEGLKEIMPGLKLAATPDVPVLSVASLLDKVGEIARPLHLVLDAPGSEMDILEGWKAADALERIDTLDLRCAQDALYAGAAGRDAVQAWLEAEGFEAVETDESDPDWPALRFSVDAKQRALTRAQRKLSKVEAELAEQKDARATAEKTAADRGNELTALKKAKEDQDRKLSEVTKLSDTRHRRLTQVETELAEQKDARATAEKTAADRGDELTALKKAKEAQDRKLSEITATADTRKTRLAEVEADLAEQKDARATAEKTAADRGNELTALKKAKEDQDRKLSEVTKLSDTRHRRLTQAEAELAELSKQRDALKTASEDNAAAAAAAQRNAADLDDRFALASDDLVTARDDLGLALQEQSYLRGELDGLRARYRELHDERDELAVLIRQLTPRLREAAGQLRALSFDVPAGHAALDVTGEAMPGTPPKTEGKRKRKARGKTAKRKKTGSA